MIPRVPGVAWMEDREEGHSSSWTRNNGATNTNCGTGMAETKDEITSLATIKSMLDVGDDWYAANNSMHNQRDMRDIGFSSNLGDPDNLFLQPVDSSASCSPSSSMFNNLDPSQLHYFLSPKPALPSFLSVVPNNPLENGIDLAEIGFLESQATNASSTLFNRGSGVLSNFTDLIPNTQITAPNICSDPQFSTTCTLQLPEAGVGFTGFRGFDENSGNTMFMSRSKLIRPLETFPSTGAQPTLFQKRAALRKSSSDNGCNVGVLGTGNGQLSNRKDRDEGQTEMELETQRTWKMGNADDGDDASIGGSGLNYDSDELVDHSKVEETGKNGGNSSNANSTVTGGDQKGKKKGMPAKNLMAERRRRKKLNDRLYMLRSVVPKISKMDRASILGDAIEYLKELLQRISDLHKELESSPPGSSVAPTPTTSFHPLTPTATALTSRIKDEVGPSSLPSPNGQPARVEVRVKEGRAVNIHMFCGRRPGLLLSTMRALDNLGLDIQQAVISCFNGFAMDIFRAEQCKEHDVHPEQIKAVLLDSAGFHV